MKKLKEVVEVTEGVGLEGLLGEQVLLICSAYFYTGRLTGVNDSFVELTDPSIVYETGPWNKSGYTNAEKLHCNRLNVMRQAVESFGVSK